jgi:Flp pilus assembly pilin Flp
MVGRIKTFFSNVKKKFSFVEFVVGGYNLSTGLNSVINSINNYLAYGK